VHFELKTALLLIKILRTL